jgi:hypothetical protein
MPHCSDELNAAEAELHSFVDDRLRNIKRIGWYRQGPDRLGNREFAT